MILENDREGAVGEGGKESKIKKSIDTLEPKFKGPLHYLVAK